MYAVNHVSFLYLYQSEALMAILDDGLPSEALVAILDDGLP